jgi:hypothetical protein
MNILAYGIRFDSGNPNNMIVTATNIAWKSHDILELYPSLLDV